MPDIAKVIAAMRRNPGDVRFADALSVAEWAFGPPRRKGGSHVVFRMPWPLDPRVNLQEGSSGKAKAYQINQLLLALDKLTAMQQAAAEPAAIRTEEAGLAKRPTTGKGGRR